MKSNSATTELRRHTTGPRFGYVNTVLDDSELVKPAGHTITVDVTSPKPACRTGSSHCKPTPSSQRYSCNNGCEYPTLPEDEKEKKDPYTNTGYQPIPTSEGKHILQTNS